MAKSLALTKLGFLTSGQAFAWTAALLAFLIPVIKGGIQIPIILLVVFWIWTPKGMGAKNGKAILIFSGIFLFHILAMAYTSDRSEGLTDLEHKISIFLFPLLFGLVQPFSKIQYRRILIGFCVGVFVGIGVSFFTSYSAYIAEDYDVLLFYTSNFSPYHHPSYFALYINLAVVILGVQLYKSENKKHIALYLIGMLVLALTLIFPASKMGFINFVVAIIFLLFTAWRMGKLKSKKSLFVVLIFLAFLTFLKVDPVASNRVAQSVEVNTGMATEAPKETESNAARRIVWQIAVEEALENPFGVGTGDVGDHMDEAYREKGFFDIAESSLNPHNSFLQIAVAQGIIAMLWFIYSLIFPMRKIIREKQWVYGFFIISIFINFLVESMLETQSGVIFFAFFNVIFFFYIMKPEGSREPIPTLEKPE